MLVQMGQQTIHLLGREGGGRTTAHVEGADGKTRILHHLSRLRDLRHQCLQIGLHQVERFLHRLGDEGAIAAAGRAEGNAHIEGDVVGRKSLLGNAACLGGLHAQTGTLRGDEIRLFQRLFRLRWALPTLHQAGG